MTLGVACPPPILQFFLPNGELNVGGYVAPTVGGVPTAVYQDSGLTTPLPLVPIPNQTVTGFPLNSYGHPSNAAGASQQLFLIPNTVYVFTMYDSSGNQLSQAAYVNGVQVSITQAIIGQELYPQSAAELAASVTPSNYAYPPGNVLRYGADPTGASSSQSAFTFAVAVAVFGGGVVYAPTGTYKLVSPVGSNVNSGVRIYGDGPGSTVINQTTDNHCFSFGIINSTQGRLVVENLSIVAALGSAMTTGCAIRLQGYTNNANSPARSLIIENVVINGATNADEFKYGIFANGVVASWISGVEIGLKVSSTTSVGLHIESTSSSSSPSLAWDVYGIQIYNGNTSVEIINNQTLGGVQGIHFMGGNLVGANNGVIATNQQGLAVIAQPDLTFVGVHINAFVSVMSINAFTSVFIDDCLFYTNATTGSIIALIGVQNFEIDVQTACLGATDIPVLSMTNDSHSTGCGNGRLSGFFQGLLTGNPVVSVTGAQSVFNIRITNASLNGYSSWVPRVSSAPTYTGSIMVDLKSCWPLTADEVQVTVTPSGGVAGGGTLNLTYVQAPEVLVNATAGTITAITPYAGYPNGGQVVTLVCNGAGVQVANNTTIRPPGAANFTFGAGSSIELYQENAVPFWRAISSET